MDLTSSKSVAHLGASCTNYPNLVISLTVESHSNPKTVNWACFSPWLDGANNRKEKVRRGGMR